MCNTAVQVQRHESCRIVLHGRSEFEASNVTLKGDQSFEVPNGFKMIVTSGLNGSSRSSLEPLQAEPSWQWKYTMGADKHIRLELAKASNAVKREQVDFDAAALSYII